VFRRSVIMITTGHHATGLDASTPLSSVAVIHYTLTASYFTYTRRKYGRVELACFGDSNPVPPAHKSEQASEWLTP